MEAQFQTSAGDAEAILSFRDVVRTFDVNQRIGRSALASIRAVAGVTLDLAPGEILGLVGESGCGKSTLARMSVGMEVPDQGEVRFEGVPLGQLGTLGWRRFRRAVQMVFQDPFASLNPRMKIRDIVGEAWDVHGTGYRGLARRQGIATLLEEVGLEPGHAERYPSAFSGGQRQRIAIARSLAVGPRVLICDEPVSALDVSIQAQILNLLAELQATHDLSYIFISHDLSVVKHISTRIAVMYAGRIVEVGPAERIFSSPRHPYTALLLAATPGAGSSPAVLGGREILAVEGPVGAGSDRGRTWSSGCAFRDRCPRAGEECAQVVPILEDKGDGVRVACHFPGISWSRDSGSP